MDIPRFGVDVMVLMNAPKDIKRYLGTMLNSNLRKAKDRNLIKRGKLPKNPENL